MIPKQARSRRQSEGKIPGRENVRINRGAARCCCFCCRCKGTERQRLPERLSGDQRAPRNLITGARTRLSFDTEARTAQKAPRVPAESATHPVNNASAVPTPQDQTRPPSLLYVHSPSMTEEKYRNSEKIFGPAVIRQRPQTS